MTITQDSSRRDVFLYRVKDLINRLAAMEPECVDYPAGERLPPDMEAKLRQCLDDSDDLYEEGMKIAITDKQRNALIATKKLCDTLREILPGMART